MCKLSKTEFDISSCFSTALLDGTLTVFDSLEDDSHLVVTLRLEHPRHGTPRHNTLFRAFSVNLLWLQPLQGLFAVISRARYAPGLAFSASRTSKVTHQSAATALPALLGFQFFHLEYLPMGRCKEGAVVILWSKCQNLKLYGHDD